MRTTKKPNTSTNTPARPQKWARNERDLATLLGVAASTVKTWKRKDGAPIADSAGKYNVKEWMTWASKHGKDTPGLDPQSKQDWEIEKIKRQVADLDIDLAKKRGELVASDDVRQWVADAVHASKTEMLSIPSKLAPQVVGLSIAEAELCIRQAIHDALMRLHREPWSKEDQS